MLSGTCWVLVENIASDDAAAALALLQFVIVGSVLPLEPLKFCNIISPLHIYVNADHHCKFLIEYSGQGEHLHDPCGLLKLMPRMRPSHGAEFHRKHHGGPSDLFLTLLALCSKDLHRGLGWLKKGREHGLTLVTHVSSNLRELGAALTVVTNYFCLERPDVREDLPGFLGFSCGYWYLNKRNSSSLLVLIFPIHGNERRSFLGKVYGVGIFFSQGASKDFHLLSTLRPQDFLPLLREPLKKSLFPVWDLPMGNSFPPS
ncbi:hypothetical protein VNO77_03849 [Canavalia gladiata]|uniref:Uncharacterized protein n=1 Tax=Canavalia gladiata TaxID=3824 RepID=A0AAN9MW32_CANGL